MNTKQLNILTTVVLIVSTLDFVLCLMTAGEHCDKATIKRRSLMEEEGRAKGMGTKSPRKMHHMQSMMVPGMSFTMGVILTILVTLTIISAKTFMAGLVIAMFAGSYAMFKIKSAVTPMYAHSVPSHSTPYYLSAPPEDHHY